MNEGSERTERREPPVRKVNAVIGAALEELQAQGMTRTQANGRIAERMKAAHAEGKSWAAVAREWGLSMSGMQARLERAERAGRQEARRAELAAGLEARRTRSNGNDVANLGLDDEVAQALIDRGMEDIDGLCAREGREILDALRSSRRIGMEGRFPYRRAERECAQVVRALERRGRRLADGMPGHVGSLGLAAATVRGLRGKGLHTVDALCATSAGQLRAGKVRGKALRAHEVEAVRCALALRGKALEGEDAARTAREMAEQKELEAERLREKASEKEEEGRKL